MPFFFSLAPRRLWCFVSSIAVLQLQLLLPTVHSFVIHHHHRTSSSSFFELYSSTNPNNPAGELTSALARLDQQWQIQQRQQPGGKPSRWRTIRLEENEDGENETTSDKQQPSSPLDAFMAEMSDAAGSSSPNNVVYLLEPPSGSTPSCILTFVGGAGLGTYPQIAYNELLLRLSDRLNAAILATPYTVGLDHFALAQQAGELTRRALVKCQDDASLGYSPNLPVYSLAHSLGAKLATIYLAATNDVTNCAGMGWIAYNNFEFAQTIGMAKQFAEQIAGSSSPSGGATNELLDQVFSFAETAVSAIGLDFSPTAQQMDKLVALKYNPEWQAKTRLFTFDQDTLQNTRDFCQACSDENDANNDDYNRPDVSELPGTHLTPVYFEIGLDEIPDADMQDMASQAMGGFQKASFGNEEELNLLVDEICAWILRSASPSRRPDWQRERPQISAGSSDSSSSQADE